MDQLITNGEVRRGSIGASFQDLTPELAEAFGLSTFQGAVVARIVQDSAAEDAGLEVGDIVTATDRRAIRNAADLYNRVGLSAVGQVLEMDILRQGSPRKVRVEVRPIPVPQAVGQSISRHLSGALLKDLLPPGEEQSVGILLESVEPGSAAASLGFAAGDILFGVNRTRTRSIADLTRVLSTQNVKMYQIRRGYDDLLVYVR
jgi:S1-C subfamily serine protease